MTGYTVEPLGSETWEAFAKLVERHNGVWGGCWCLAFHPKSLEGGQSVEGNRALKQRLVNDDRAHAALVFDGDRAVGWCQYGTPQDLPRIYHRKEYEAGLVVLPDYRLTCFFVDREYRREGVSAVALRGALNLIAEAGGGVVEGYPQDTQGKEVSASFLYNGTRGLFEQAGFAYDRPKGKNHCVMTTTVAPELILTSPRVVRRVSTPTAVHSVIAPPQAASRQQGTHVPSPVIDACSSALNSSP